MKLTKIDKKDILIDQQQEIIAEYELLIQDFLDVAEYENFDTATAHNYDNYAKFVINECKNLQYKLNKIERVK